MCRGHYEAMLKRRRDERNGNGHNGDVFDRRFVSLFCNELQERGSPRYPENGWYGALSVASFEFEHLGPTVTLKPQICAGEMGETSGTRNYTGYGAPGDDLIRSVGSACDRWLHQRGIGPDRLF